MGSFEKASLDYLDKVRLGIQEISEDSSSYFENIFSKIPLNKGKLFRPLLIFSFFNIFNDKNDNFDKFLVDFSVAVEILHISTLLHDDVIDNASIRRSSSSLNAIFDNRVAILAGDLLFAKSFKIITESNFEYSKQISQVISKATEELVVGELTEELASFDSFTIDDYIKILIKKTSSLFVASASIGSIVATGYQNAMCEKFGESLGIAFQVRDDYLDYFDDSTGKERFKDLKEKKITLPILILKDLVNKQEFDFLVSLFQKDIAIVDKDIIRISDLFVKYNIQCEVQKHIDFYLKTTRDAMLNFKDCVAKTSILKMLEKLVV